MSHRQVNEWEHRSCGSQKITREQSGCFGRVSHSVNSSTEVEIVVCCYLCSCVQAERLPIEGNRLLPDQSHLAGMVYRAITRRLTCGGCFTCTSKTVKEIIVGGQRATSVVHHAHHPKSDCAAPAITPLDYRPADKMTADVLTLFSRTHRPNVARMNQASVVRGPVRRSSSRTRRVQRRPHLPRGRLGRFGHHHRPAGPTGKGCFVIHCIAAGSLRVVLAAIYFFWHRSVPAQPGDGLRLNVFTAGNPLSLISACPISTANQSLSRRLN